MAARKSERNALGKHKPSSHRPYWQQVNFHQHHQSLTARAQLRQTVSINGRPACTENFARVSMPLSRRVTSLTTRNVVVTP